jgi:hypothetical protein
LTQGITCQGNLIFKESQIQLVAYTDFDWVGNVDDRRYITKYCFKLLGGAISWNNKRQNTILLSEAHRLNTW